MNDYSCNRSSINRFNKRSRMLGELFQEFSKHFSSESECLKEIYRRLYKNGRINCRHCESTSVSECRNSRAVKCLNCRRLTWLTAGTFFHGIRKGSPWLFTVWCFERGIHLNSVELEILAGIAQSSALNILKKVGIVIEGLMDSDILQVPSFEFDEIICKRSRETPANQHPRSEKIESQSSEVQPVVIDSDTLNFSIEEKDVYDLLSNNPVSIESLCQNSTKRANQIISTLTILELRGLVSHDYGERYYITPESSIPMESSMDTVVPEVLETEVKSINSRIKSKCHGVSRKYLQIYIAINWFVSSLTRRRDCDLVSYCLKHKKIYDSQILLYSSPKNVRISILNAAGIK